MVAVAEATDLRHRPAAFIQVSVYFTANGVRGNKPGMVNDQRPCGVVLAQDRNKIGLELRVGDRGKTRRLVWLNPRRRVDDCKQPEYRFLLRRRAFCSLLHPPARLFPSFVIFECEAQWYISIRRVRAQLRVRA